MMELKFIRHLFIGLTFIQAEVKRLWQNHRILFFTDLYNQILITPLQGYY